MEPTCLTCIAEGRHLGRQDSEGQESRVTSRDSDPSEDVILCDALGFSHSAEDSVESTESQGGVV